MKRQIRCTGWRLLIQKECHWDSLPDVLERSGKKALQIQELVSELVELLCGQACWSCFPFKVFMPLPILSNQYQRESASKSREKSLFVQLVNKLLTNCCLSYFKLAGRRWVMQGAPCRLLLFTSSVPMFAPTSKLLAPSPSLCPSQSKSHYFHF